MSEISVSKDALTKVKAALNDYYIDISGFSTRIGQQISVVSKSADLEMQKIKQKIEETTNRINQYKAEINRLADTINQMNNEIKSTEQKLVSAQNDLTANQTNAMHIKKQISEMEQAAARAEGEVKEKIQKQIDDRRNQLYQTESEIRSSENELFKLKECGLQLQQKVHVIQAEKAKKEDELRTTERFLDRLRNKQERMNASLAKMNDNINTMLSASKSFETQAVSGTEQNVGNIEKCIAAVDKYLSENF
ncbi:MAG: hypothetical protein FWC36_10980 [Spirochaetes bacterium]|nr:hypothetical protein [Spirochaetota bacterium]